MGSLCGPFCVKCDPPFSVRNGERHVSSCPTILVIDARVAFSCLESEGLPQDPRTALDLLSLKETLQDESSCSLCRWIPGP